MVGYFPIEYLKLIREALEEFDEVEYEVEEILDHKGDPGDRIYKTKWKNFSKATWEPQSQFTTTDCILDYWDKVKDKNKKKKKKGNKKKS